MDFTQNDWSQRDIINKIIILTKRGTYVMHATITKKYQKYPSTTILKYINVLAKVNKSPLGCLHHMKPQGAQSISTHAHTMTKANISQKQKG